MIQAAESDNGKDKKDQHPRTCKTITQVAFSVMKGEGPLGFFKGLRAQILKTVLSSALLLMIKEKINATTWMLILAIQKSLLLNGASSARRLKGTQ